MTYLEIERFIDNGCWVRRKCWPIGVFMRWNNMEKDIEFTRDGYVFNDECVLAKDWETVE